MLEARAAQFIWEDMEDVVTFTDSFGGVGHSPFTTCAECLVQEKRIGMAEEKVKLLHYLQCMYSVFTSVFVCLYL